MPPSTARAEPGSSPRAGRPVGDGGSDLIGGDESAVRLTGMESGALGTGGVGRVAKARDPGGVHGAGVDAVEADALADVVGEHGRGAGVRDSTAPLLAKYRARWGSPAVAAMEQTLTTEAWREARR